MSTDTIELTPEQVTDLGKFGGPIYLSKLSVEERLAGLSSEEVLGRFKPEALLKELSLEELEAYLRPVKRNHSSSKTH